MEWESPMKKLIAITLASLMLLVVGCKLEVEVTEKDKYYMIMDSGKILVSGGFTEDMLREVLLATDEVKDYHILINSRGGDAYALLGMINRVEYLQSQGAHITTESYGYAFSAGLFLFLSGDTRIIHKGSALMFHCAGIQKYATRLNLKSEEVEPHTKDMLQIVDDTFVQMMLERILTRGETMLALTGKMVRIL